MTELTFGLADGATRFECLGNLVIQFRSVRYDHKGPVARNLSQDLLCEEHHRKTFSRTLGLPEDPATTIASLPSPQRSSDSIVDPEVLMVLSKRFNQSALMFRKEREVFSDV